jgi:hypothetical protein
LLAKSPGIKRILSDLIRPQAHYKVSLGQKFYDKNNNIHWAIARYFMSKYNLWNKTSQIIINNNRIQHPAIVKA